MYLLATAGGVSTARRDAQGGGPRNPDASSIGCAIVLFPSAYEAMRLAERDQPSNAPAVKATLSGIVTETGAESLLEDREGGIAPSGVAKKLNSLHHAILSNRFL
jgi:hypothetical protein